MPFNTTLRRTVELSIHKAAISASKKDQYIRPNLGERAESWALSVWNPDPKQLTCDGLQGWENVSEDDISKPPPDITFKKIVQESRESPTLTNYIPSFSFSFYLHYCQKKTNRIES